MTNRQRLCAGGDAALGRHCLLLQARYAIAAEVDVLQIRERGLEAAELARVVWEIVRLARGSRTRVIVNDRVDVALACGAAGVHLRGDSVPPHAVRSIVPAGFVVGRAVHSVAEAVAVARDVDYVVAGTVWPTSSKPGAESSLGPAGLAAIVRAVPVPVVAIGGITLEHLGDVRAAGAAGVAAIGLFMRADSLDRSPCRAIPLQEIVQALHDA